MLSTLVPQHLLETQPPVKIDGFPDISEIAGEPGSNIHQGYLISRVGRGSNSYRDHAPFYGIEDLLCGHQGATGKRLYDKPAIGPFLKSLNNDQQTGLVGRTCSRPVNLTSPFDDLFSCHCRLIRNHQNAR